LAAFSSLFLIQTSERFDHRKYRLVSTEELQGAPLPIHDLADDPGYALSHEVTTLKNANDYSTYSAIMQYTWSICRSLLLGICQQPSKDSTASIQSSTTATPLYLASISDPSLLCMFVPLYRNSVMEPRSPIPANARSQRMC
jgi:hypothetical protein